MEQLSFQTKQQRSLKPVLKWAGGKRQLLSRIRPYIPDSVALYVEPFLGGAAVLLDLQPDRALISDSNPELINVYRVIRDNPLELIESLREHQAHDSSDYYYEIRSMDRDESFAKVDSITRAARIIYLNKTCYNGLYRVNSSGQLNVPYGRYKNPRIVESADIIALSNYLNGDITIRCCDYADALKNLPEGSFVYLDPPYMPISESASFTGYTESGFAYKEQVKLRDECKKLRDNGIAFLESNSDCKEIRELYRGFSINTVKARRSINSRGDARGMTDEVLITA